MQNLEKMLFEAVELNTPDEIKKDCIFDYKNEDEFTFKLTQELVEKLNLWDWFKNYKKEAAVSTAGIRGAQNVLYPHDTRFPINTIGITLATLAKALVLLEKYPEGDIIKLAGREVRYNSPIFLNIISKIQAGLGIKTILPTNKKTIPIWLASFLAFKLDLVGGEYITSSHGISVKNATKDLNNQGSQFLPDESMEFVNKMEEILNEVKTNGFYEIKFAANNDPNLDFEVMKKTDNGATLYIEYLKNGVATEENIELIKKFEDKIVIDSVGGCAYTTLSKILKNLGVEDKFVWFNTEEDPFFHGIGKDTKIDKEGKKVFYDWSLDIGVVGRRADGTEYFPVIETLKYDEKLKDLKTGTVCLVTDPDHDRLSILQVDSKENLEKIKSLGIDTVELPEDRVLSIYSPNQAFLMVMDFWAQSLKKKGVFDAHERFIVKTTPSSASWDEWASANGIKSINTPVGFKEIANVIKKIENQIAQGVKDIAVEDIYGKEIHLGESPRMIFGGEESGGMIIGSENFITSLSGRRALAMREKSATEAIILAAALTASLNIPLWAHLDKIYSDNKIISRFDVREDISYYNESEPDINKLKLAKTQGEALRTKNDLFFLTLALAKTKGKITTEVAKEILSSTFADLDFANLIDIAFVGDGTLLKFADKFVEIRPSGTDAKTKAYAGGSDKEELSRYAKILGNYSGEKNATYEKYITEEFYNNAKETSFEIYGKFAGKNADTREFKPVSFDFILEHLS